MTNLEALKPEASAPPEGEEIIRCLAAQGLREHLDEPVPIAKAYAVAHLFTAHQKWVYPHDLVAGSFRGKFASGIPAAALKQADELYNSFGWRHFGTNANHFAPDYESFLQDGITGTLEKIRLSRQRHAGGPEKILLFLDAAAITMEGFGQMVTQYGEEAARLAGTLPPEENRELLEIAAVCQHLTERPPSTFREALQLVWLAHVAFVYEGRYAMAFGRMDQYLYPYYQRDVDAGLLTPDFARELLACTLYKIADAGRDDVCNIAIGGVDADGKGAVNDLSYLLLDAVEACGIPGPNLSARLFKGAPDEFLDACLRVIGTGIGYPALMNDEINIPALARYGYSLADCRNYCMVGCIENFIAGKQPPWSDGRYNSPKYLELALNDGRCLQTGVQMGPHTGGPGDIRSMEEYLDRLHQQMKAGAALYMAYFRNENDRYNRTAYMQPFLSCFCQDCIGRGLDINDAGSLYPSAHGVGCMGIGTIADSLAAIERVIFEEKFAALTELRDALKANFVGYDELHQRLLAAPKYGNNDPFVDKYAVWFVEEHDRLFRDYRTPDGGPIYTAIASNINNIPAGLEVAATPDGRLCAEPLSDAASPMHGMDKKGPTAVVLSTTRPDYTLVACGTVLNQKYSPSMFTDPEKRAKLRALIRVYFEKGGQEMQINAVSREVLQDAREHPERYGSLVVRVSGFSAFYTTLDPAVQEDILKRTEQG